MVAALAPKGGDLTGAPARELAGVLAHEIGHIELRHTLRALLANSAVTVVTATLFGDFSALVTAVPVILVGSDYSRDMESEADAYAVQLLIEHDISPGYMANVFELLHKKSLQSPASKMPKWMRFATDFTASHPSDETRIQRFRDAAAKSSAPPPAEPVAPERSAAPVTPTTP
jgi:Zn-dependent protease with chaperone function